MNTRGKHSPLSLLLLAALAALLIGLPLFLNSIEQYHIVHVLCLIGIYAVLALGLNVIIGYTGILNLGYAGFYGVGAYTAALLAIHLKIPFLLLLPICGVVAALFGVLLGMPTLRLRGDYIAIVTLGFVEITRLVFNNFDALTNGPKGLPGVGQTIPVPEFSLGSLSFKLDNDLHFYYFILALCVLTVVVVSRLHNSRVGRSWVAIREDETAAEAMGINTTLMKIHAFAAGTFFAGLAGCVYTHWIGFITPELFTFMESILLVSMIVLGGLGSIPGVILGVVLIVGIPEILRDVIQAVFEDATVSVQQSYDNLILARMLIFGIIMVIMVIFRPQGIIPSRRPRPHGAPPPEAQ